MDLGGETTGSLRNAQEKDHIGTSAETTPIGTTIRSRSRHLRIRDRGGANAKR